jgi:hypothetical protein
MIATYLDERTHNFKIINGLSLEQLKQKLKSEIQIYKKKYPF